jgi:hypothetical protein
MRKYFGAAAVVVFLLAIVLAVWQGGRDIFKSPVASIPYLLIDYNSNETGIYETELYIHGMNDFRYSNISMRVTIENMSSERTRKDTYFMFFNTTAKNFTVNITVWNKDKGYSFNASFQAATDQEAPKLLTLYEDRGDKIYPYMLDNSNLPWKRLMERMR